jgi:hypothetical protein
VHRSIYLSVNSIEIMDACWFMLIPFFNRLVDTRITDFQP